MIVQIGFCAFEDGVGLLGHDQSRAVEALDYLLGGVLAVGAPLTGGATIGLFDPLLAGMDLSPAEEARIASTVRDEPERRDMVGGWLPAPGPHRPFDMLMDQIHEHYSQMSRRLRDWIRT